MKIKWLGHSAFKIVVFPLATVDEFLEGKTNVRRVGDSQIEVQASALPEAMEIVVLEHAL